MKNVIYLLLRRMRLPLIVVIMAYTISMTGLVLIPGVDDQGNVWHMTLFHAFYFVSYMGTTIGFGELPYTFTDSQRLWTSFAMYLTVISWLYAIGSLFKLLQDQAFLRVLSFTTFTRSVRKLKQPFYLVCGLGDAGQLVVRELATDGIQSVVIDRDESRVQALPLEQPARWQREGTLRRPSPGCNGPVRR